MCEINTKQYIKQKWDSIIVTVRYLNSGNTEELEFHPCNETKVGSWKTITAFSSIEAPETALMDQANECIICLTLFKKFPFFAVTPCGHNSVCAQCAMRMRFFGDFNLNAFNNNQSNPKKNIPACPYCKVFLPIV